LFPYFFNDIINKLVVDLVYDFNDLLLLEMFHELQFHHREKGLEIKDRVGEQALGREKK